jgi:chromate transport protein ChrA
MEFLTFSLVFAAAWLIWRRPEKERLAAGLLVVSIVLMVFLFSLGTRTSLLPGRELLRSRR